MIKLKRELGFLYRKIVFFFESYFEFVAFVVAVGLGLCWANTNYVQPFIANHGLQSAHDFLFSYLAIFQNLPVVGAVFRISWVNPHTYYFIGGVYGAIVGGYYLLMFIFNKRELWLNLQLWGVRHQFIVGNLNDDKAKKTEENGKQSISTMNIGAERTANRMVKRTYGMVDSDGRRVVVVPAGRSVDVVRATKEHCENVPAWVAGKLKGDWPTEFTVEYGWFGQFLTMTEKTAFSNKKSNNAVKIAE